MIPQKIVAKRTVAPRTVHDFEVKSAHHYILANGAVSHNSYVPTNTMSGGTGAQYAASTLLFCSKSYEKSAEKETIGSIIKFVTEKSRLTREKQKVESLLRYDGGIDRYYGLVNFALEMGLLKKAARGFEWSDGTKVSEKSLIGQPEKHFTQPILEKIDEWCGKRFKYVSGAITEDDSAEDGEFVEDESVA